jgi:hypothetical protein
VSKVAGKLARIEQALHARRRRKGSIEYHYPQGMGPSSRLEPCDLRDQHGEDCVMTVSPTNSGVRFTRIIRVTDE